MADYTDLDPATAEATSTTPPPEEKPEQEYQPNRRQRRSKGMKIGMHTMRQWHARSIMDKLFSPKVANGPVSKVETEPPPV